MAPKVTFLGTGCMQPTKERNHSAIHFAYDKENFLFDCGEGTQRQMRFASLKPARLSKIFITHWHGDHCFGIPGIMSAMGADHFVGTLEIYGPKGTKVFLRHMLKGFARKHLIKYTVTEIDQKVVYEHVDFRIEAQPLKHSVTCIGFSVVEKDRVRIDVKKAKKLGLRGPILGTLQQGKNVKFNGKLIKSKDVTYITKGKKVSYIADTVKCPGADRLAKGCDLLICEGTHCDDILNSERKYMHLTVKEAGEIAKKGKVKELIITHISQRYKNSAEILKEAKKTFKKVRVAQDFMVVEV